MTLWNLKKTRFLHEIDKLVCYTVPTPHMCPIMSTISTTLNMTTIIIMNQYDKRVSNMSTMSTISSILIMSYTPVDTLMPTTMPMTLGLFTISAMKTMSIMLT